MRAGLYRFALYAFRRRRRALPGEGVGGARSWTRNSLSTPLATDFGPGPDGAAGGRAAGRGVCFSTLLAANFGPGLDGAVEGCAVLAWSLASYLSLTGLSTGGQAMLCHWSQHRDHHLRLYSDPPPLMGWGRPAPFYYWHYVLTCISVAI